MYKIAWCQKQNLHLFCRGNFYLCNRKVPSCKIQGVLPALEIPHVILQNKGMPEYFLQTTL